MNQCYAHTLPDTPPGEWEPLEDHLRDVGAFACDFASRFGAEDWGKVLGWWHDLGKYSAEFQSYLHRTMGYEAHLETLPDKVDHSTAGAKHANKELGPEARIVAYCIAGHHTGLLDAISASGTAGLNQRLKKTIPAIPQAPESILRQPRLSSPRLTLDHGNEKRASFQLGLFTRMLFSSLVDADYLATEAFMSPERRQLRSTHVASIDSMISELDRKLSSLKSATESVVSRSRADVLRACQHAAAKIPGLFSLTVPTGGGKTLSSLAFALQHSRHHKKDRVIYAIPFTSIIEQTASVFRAVFRRLPPDTVLEHHSSLDPDKESCTARLAAENWDAPLVVTTNVQLFESLFAARTSRCRKLHRVCNSVIILDEAQTIPVELLEPTLAVIRELTTDYGCSVVLCTATQPAVIHREEFEIGLEGVREIIPEPAALYQQMKRVSVSYVGKQTDDNVAELLGQHDQFLCIVNTRPHAAKLYDTLRLARTHTPDSSPPDSLVHLSTRMCGQHRSDVLTAIRRKLDNDQPCQVISTQLIEAGVDVDFPVVFRALSGIDSIAQAAGRCNREGKRNIGQVMVFDPTDVRLRGYLKSTADTAGELIAGQPGDDIDLLNMDFVKSYFLLHYHRHKGDNVRKGDGWDRHDVMECFPTPMQKMQFDFRAAADRFRWIEDATETVFIPYDDEGRQMLERLRQVDTDPKHIGELRSLLRRLQRYSVGVYSNVFDKMKGADIEVRDSGYAILINDTCYDQTLGFCPDKAGYHNPDTLLV